MNEQVTTKSVGIKYGLLIGIISIAITLVLYMFKLEQNRFFGFLPLIIMVAVVIMAHKEFKDKGDSYMSYAQGFGIGFIMSVVSSIVGALFHFVYHIVDPSVIARMKENNMMEMEKSGYSDEQIESTLAIMGKVLTPIGITLIGMVSGIVMGIIVVAIITIFTKKNSPEFEV